MVYILKQDQLIMTRSYIPLGMMRPSLSLFGIIRKASSTTEKQLMNLLETAQSSYNKMKIQDVAWLRPQYNIALFVMT